jgi:hypothetical protein
VKLFLLYNNILVPLETRVKAEMTAYSAEINTFQGIHDANYCPLQTWRIIAPKYPLLAQLVPKFLCIPATSAPVERLFSAAGSLVSKRRTKLSPEIVDMMLFLNKNYRVE